MARENFLEATFNLALTYHEMSILDSALIFYNKTLEIKYDLLRAHVKIAKVLEEQDKKNQALEKYKEIVRIEPAYFVKHPTKNNSWYNTEYSKFYIVKSLIVDCYFFAIKYVSVFSFLFDVFTHYYSHKPISLTIENIVFSSFSFFLKFSISIFSPLSLIIVYSSSL